MVTRREIIKTGAVISATAASGALTVSGLQAAELGRSGPISRMPTVLHPDIKRLVSPALQTSLGSETGNLEWRNIAASSGWLADNLQMHTRYFPSRDGAHLPVSLAAKRVSQQRHKESHFNVLPGAIVTSVHPFGMLVNRKKAARLGVHDYTAQAFSSAGAKAELGLRLMAGSPINCWVTPYFASIGALEPGFWDIDGEDAAYYEDAHSKIIALLENVDVTPYRHAEDIGPGIYEKLVDSKQPKAAAIFGDPVRLEKYLAERSRKETMAEFEVVAIQDFLTVNAPSLFARRYIQLGVNAHEPMAEETLHQLADTMLQCDALDLMCASDPSAKTASDWKTLSSTHNFKHYANVPEMEHFTDGHLLAKFMVGLVSTYHGMKRASTEFSSRNIFANVIELRGTYHFVRNFSGGPLLA